MKIIRNIPGFGKLFYTLHLFGKYAPGIQEAKDAGDVVLERQRIADSTYIWASTIAQMYDMQVEVRGRENLPEEDGLVFISNHQGYGDIIAMFIACQGKQVGFIAKDTLEKVPLFGKWIKLVRGIYIKRGNAKEALRSFADGAKLIKQGFNMTIFPEGTRAKGPNMGSFKAGSFKLATKAKAPIVPITINGTHEMFEDHGVIRPSRVTVVIHPVIQTKDMDRNELRELEGKVESTIRNCLNELEAEKRQKQ